MCKMISRNYLVQRQDSIFVMDQLGTFYLQEPDWFDLSDIRLMTVYWIFRGFYLSPFNNISPS